MDEIKSILLGNMQFRDKDDKFTAKYEEAVILVISKSMFELIMENKK